MKEPIIPIRRASDSWILAMIDIGILVVTENGMTTAEEWGKA